MQKFNNLLKLLSWNNQSFPIGSYSFSSGLEYAIEKKILVTSSNLQLWLRDLLKFGNLQTDGVLLIETWKLKRQNKNEEILDLNNFAITLNQSYEKYIENSEQGKSFIKIASDAWGHKFESNNLIFPIAYACSAFQENICLKDSLLSFLHASINNLLSCAIKLIPLGQTEGQKIMVQLNIFIDEEYKTIIKKDLSKIGNCGWCNDIVSMRHENQYTRLFRT